MKKDKIITIRVSEKEKKKLIEKSEVAKLSLSEYLIKNNIDIKWMVETRIDKKYIDTSVACLLYKSGCREISFGIESYNKRILNDMNNMLDTCY